MDNFKTWTGLFVEVDENGREQRQMEIVRPYGVANRHLLVFVVTTDETTEFNF